MFEMFRFSDNANNGLNMKQLKTNFKREQNSGGIDHLVRIAMSRAPRLHASLISLVIFLSSSRFSNDGSADSCVIALARLSSAFDEVLMLGVQIAYKSHSDYSISVVFRCAPFVWLCHLAHLFLLVRSFVLAIFNATVFLAPYNRHQKNT